MAEPSVVHPWMDITQSPLKRADLLLAALSFEQKIQMALAAASEQGKEMLGDFNIPELSLRDGPNGVHGETGVTAFPSAQALAATFNRSLAEEFGAAVGEELRAKGANTWLGPAMDIARTPLSGRQAEALGEDPYLAGQLAAAEVKGAKSQHVIAMLKHFVANNQEYLRTGFAGPPPFGAHSPATNVVISEKALQEIYLSPLKEAIQAGGADSVMTSYNRINGLQTCENPQVMGTLRNDWGFAGFAAPDFAFAVRDPLAAAQTGLDLPSLGETETAGRTADMFTSGKISAERLDDICRRILYAKFDAGLFDTLPTPARADVSTAAHIDLARRIAVESMVLLKNEQSILPLSARGDRSIAVIGTAGEDAQWIMGGSAGVTMTPENSVTPLAGIRARLGAGGKVVFEQGSLGDVPLSALPETALSPAQGDGHGLLGQYWDNAEWKGEPILERVEARIEGLKKPDEVNSYPWSARWMGTIHPPETGVYRFALLSAGIVGLYINEQPIATGYREATRFFSGPMLPVQGTVQLTAGIPALIRIEFCSGAALFGGEVSLGWQTPDASLIPAAVEAARQADTAVVFASTATGEGMDRGSLSLPGDQDRLIAAVAEANPHTVVVLNTGGAVLMPWLDKVAAVVQAWYPGEQFGSAIAGVLFGDADPGGRLPITFPENEKQGPAPASQPEHYPGINLAVQYAEGVFVGYRWYDQYQQEPLFPFGYGLSYASFEYADLDAQMHSESGAVEISIRVQNTARRGGAAMVQVYVGMPDGCNEPPLQLKGFEKINLGAGESRTIHFTLDPKTLAIFEPASRAWQVAPGRYTVWVGSSSRQLSQCWSFEVSS
jgi:beta-glucosidase